jgi:monoamine oxidase
MDESEQGTSRRGFLGAAGVAAAGTATLLQVMTGAAPAHAATAPSAFDGPAKRVGDGRSVAILGAGPAGLAAAIRLLEAGFRVTVLEAGDRVGGRTLAARPGDTISEVWDDGSVRTQTCAFDQDLYLNLGAGRIPYHHQRVINLCRKLQVPLEPYIHTTMANLFQTDNAWKGAPRPYRRIVNDCRGYVSQFAAAAAHGGSRIEDGLTGPQRELFQQMLVEFGRIDGFSRTYTGSTRSGLIAPPTVTQPEEPVDPLLLKDLLASRFWDNGVLQDWDYHWQTTSFQPVGGMDNIWRYAAASLPQGTIVFNAPVDAVALDGDGVTVAWTTRDGASASSQRFDYCLSNIPLSILRGLRLENFDGDFLTAVRSTPFTPACKVGWQANRRFWESARYQIFGGISRIDHEISQIWYPSNDYFSTTDKGTLTGAYCSGDRALTLGDRPFQERLDVARKAGTKLHDEFASNAIVPDPMGISIAWHKVPTQRGAWAAWDPAKPGHKDWYQTLLRPQGQDNFFVIGDQVSSLPGWQEGALMSAEWAYGWIVDYARAARTPVVVQQVPDARALTGGDF